VRKTLKNTMNSSFPLGVKQSTNQEKPRRIMKDFRFLGGRWAYGLLKWSEKVETFFLLTKKKSGISKKKIKNFSKNHRHSLHPMSWWMERGK
jgi:hypothetical protein